MYGRVGVTPIDLARASGPPAIAMARSNDLRLLTFLTNASMSKIANASKGRAKVSEMDSLKARLVHARNLLGITQEELAKRAGVAASTIANLETGSRLVPRALLEIASALGVSPGWLKDGTGEMKPGAYVLSVDPGQFSLTGKPLAHLVTLDKRTVSQKVTREQIVAGESGKLYSFALDDDALAPDHPRGREFVFDADKQPAPGAVVLVLDQHQQLHAREFRQGSSPDQWQAAAVNRAYSSFDGASVKLLATASYLKLP